MLVSPLSSSKQFCGTSVFRPPSSLLRSIPPQKKMTMLTAAAQPWSPSSTTTQPPVTAAAPPAALSTANATAVSLRPLGPKPPAPLHSTPPLTAQAPGHAPSAISPTLLPSMTPTILVRDLLTLTLPHTASSNSLPSPVVSTPIATPLSCSSKSVITAEAVESGVYTFDMLMSLRKDACHTPRRVLNWVLQLYRAAPQLKVPAHLQLSIDEPTLDDEDDAADRAALGAHFKGKTRARPIRQVHHKVMSVLSRVTPQKYAELQKELMELPLKQTDDLELQEVVHVFFEKAVQEQAFSKLYAGLVADICRVTDAEKDLDKDTRERLISNRMRRELLTTCREEFQRPLQLSEDDKVDPTTGKPLDVDEIEMKRDRLKKRLCGNIKFVGELFKMRLVTERVIGAILHILVGAFDEKQPTLREDYVFEVFATLLKVIGIQCKETCPEMLTEYMLIAKRVEKAHPIARVRFQMMDLEDLAKRGWVLKDALLTKDEREREIAEDQRKASEDIERRAKQKQQEINEHQIATAMGRVKPAPLAPFSSSGMSSPPTASSPASATVARTPEVLKYPTQQHHHHYHSTFSSSSHHAQHNGNNGLPHGTPTASPAKKAPLTTTTTSSTPTMMTPPPKYRTATVVERSPLHHASALQHQTAALPSSGSMNMLSDSVLMMSASNSTAGSAPHTPLSPLPTVPLHDLANQLMAQYLQAGSVTEVLNAIASLSFKHRVHLLTCWMRRVSITTRLFSEREQICTLFAALLQPRPQRSASRFQDTPQHPEHDNGSSSGGESAALMSAEQLIQTLLEWVRYDVECGQIENCPRMFANIAFMIQQAFSGKHATDASMAPVRHILHCGLFNVLLRELLLNDGVNYVVTLVKDVHPIATNVVSQLQDGATPRENVISAVENRFRLLSMLLHGEGRNTRAKTPTTLTTGLSTEGINSSTYDPLSACLGFPKIADDSELVLYRKMRADVDGAAWKEVAVQLALAPNNNTGHHNGCVFRSIQLMKVFGAILTCLHPKELAGGPLVEHLTPQALDDVLLAVAAKRALQPEHQAAIVAELIAHFSVTVAPPPFVAQPSTGAEHLNSPHIARGFDSSSNLLLHKSPSASVTSNSGIIALPTNNTVEARLGKMTAIFRRWAQNELINGGRVLSLLQSISAGRSDCSSSSPSSSSPAKATASSSSELYVHYHDFLTDISWNTALAALSGTLTAS